jgi:predicted transcriptional regulator of viral defense system
MRYLGKPYYVALLSAADLYGASHQKPQTFTFISDQVLHPKVKNTIRLEPAMKRHIPNKYLVKMNTQSGSITVSTPELTALDLLTYQKKAGGINNIATVLGELAERMNFEKVEADFFSGVPVAAIQRLGFLLDVIVGQKLLADCFFEKIQTARLFFRKTPLVAHLQNNKMGEYPFDTKWKIVINYKVEPDI